MKYPAHLAAARGISTQPRGNREAFGAPGIAPSWSHSNKEGVGTAYSADSRLWFTIWRGIVTEVYYPMIDQPQIRDLEYLVTDGETFFHEGKREHVTTTQRPFDHALGYRITNRDPEGRYTIDKEVIADPHLPCLLVHTRLEVHRGFDAERLRLYALCAPHLGVGGWGNNAEVGLVLGMPVLTAQRDGIALALAPSVAFRRASVGYVGRSDGWTDLRENFQMDWEFDRATEGNVALIGEIPVRAREEFTLGLAFGRTVESALTALFQSLGTPYEVHRDRYIEQWQRTVPHLLPLGHAAHDEGRLYRSSYSLLLAHEDKIFPGAFIASLSIPWGAAKGDDDRGGYHLVWTRDMVKTAEALLAAGNREAPLRALIYLATRQQADGGFPQNFWVDGRSYWSGIQLDEVAYPILLAWRLHRERALQRFDPYPMVTRAAAYLVLHGPATEQDRWEELAGYSPSTLAVSIAALTCAAEWARERGDGPTGTFLHDYADFLESHVEDWTVTDQGTLVPGQPRHYVRIRPVSGDPAVADEGTEMGTLRLPNLPPGTPTTVRADDLVDGGFLDLVRYGVRSADDPVIGDSLKVIDRVLKVDTPAGPTWHRYNGDGYGQAEDGGPYVGYGKGRAWPLLTGERGHYELAAGRDPAPYLRALERFATPTGLLPEQVWDEPDRPDLHLRLGDPTEAAMPLAWAHAEYVKLLRSASDRRVFDRVPEVSNRYVDKRRPHAALEVWKFNRRPTSIDPDASLRVLADRPFTLHWSDDDWHSAHDTASDASSIGIYSVTLAALGRSEGGYRFTFYWPDELRWEGTDFAVRSKPSPRSLDEPSSRAVSARRSAAGPLPGSERG